ncbi:MAG: HDOD domain-containing protein [Epsilonproteobacteria bacterium]|nr:HDOD domain-containing protein [Campylobacterota bacterium]
MNKSVASQIRTLPPLPKSVMEIQRITSDPNGSIADLIKVVKSDPLLTANLLKAANSPLYGFSHKIKTVDQAVSLFGMSTIKGFAIASAVRNNMKIDLSAYGVSDTQFVTISQQQNALALNWYQKDRAKLDVLSTTSFLLEIGAVIISSILVAEDLAEEFKQKVQPQNRQEVEREYVQMDTIEITAEIFNYWKFDHDLIDAVKYINDLKNAPLGEYSYALLAIYKTTNLLTPITKQSISEAIKVIEEGNLDLDAYLEAIEQIQNKEHT